MINRINTCVFFKKIDKILLKQGSIIMIITIRFADWILLGLSIIIWGADHWFIASGISHLCPVGVRFMPHTIHCLCSLIILCTFVVLFFKFFRKSFAYGILSLFYALSLVFSAYIWDYLIIHHSLFLGLMDILASILITTFISLYVSKYEFFLSFSLFPLFLWRFFLALITFLCLYEI